MTHQTFWNGIQRERVTRVRIEGGVVSAQTGPRAQFGVSHERCRSSSTGSKLKDMHPH